MASTTRWGLWMVVVALGCGGGQTSVEVAPMPDGGDYTGVYFSPQYGEMHVVQNGNAVHGEYKKDERGGKFEGEVDGNVLRFEWTELKAMVSNRPTETRGHGYFRYLIDPTNGDHLLKGRWGLGDEDSTGGEWNAYKSRNRTPEVGFATGGGESSEGDEGSSDESGGSDESEPADEESADDLF